MPSRKTISALALLVGTLGFSACGLEEYIYLEPPSSLTSGTALSFQHSTSNTISSFLGYEVYYKIYPGTSSTTAPSQATTDISAISSKISAAPGADQVVTYLSSTKGYIRMNQSSVTPVSATGSPPFAPVSSSYVSTAGVITALDLGAGEATLSVSGSVKSSYYFARGVKYTAASGDYYRPFTDYTYDSTDCDSTNAPGSNGTMAYPWMVVYAFAYALGDDFTATYSYPRLLNESSTPLYIGDLIK